MSRVAAFWWWPIIVSWVAHGLALLPDIFLFEYGLLCSDPVLVVVEELSSKEEGKLWVVSLLVFGHLLEFSPVPRHKLSQFIDNVAKVDFCQTGKG